MEFQEQVEIMREGGEILAGALAELKRATVPGKTGAELNLLAEDYIRSHEAEPAFKNYKPSFSKSAYPYTLCLSVNDIVVHGYPTAEVVLQEGDVAKLDLGLKFKGYYLDAAITTPVGRVSSEARRLIEATRQSLQQALKVTKPGRTLGDIGWVIESTLADAGFTSVKSLCGHDIGTYIHGDLQVLNFGDPGTGQKITPGMFFTIEPMGSIGSDHTIQDDDFVFRTENGSIATHFEVTLAVHDKGNYVLTPVLGL